MPVFGVLQSAVSLTFKSQWMTVKIRVKICGNDQQVWCVRLHISCAPIVSDCFEEYMSRTLWRGILTGSTDEKGQKGPGKERKKCL